MIWLIVVNWFWWKQIVTKFFWFFEIRAKRLNRRLKFIEEKEKIHQKKKYSLQNNLNSPKENISWLLIIKYYYIYIYIFVMKAILGQRIRSKTLVNFFETNTFDRSFSRKKKLASDFEYRRRARVWIFPVFFSNLLEISREFHVEVFKIRSSYFYRLRCLHRPGFLP